jgi:hypothetical protein
MVAMVPNARKKSVVSDLVLPTAGEYFSDGRILELVSDNSIPGKLALLLWDGKRALVAGRFKVGDRIYVPVSLDSSTLEAIRFPVNAIGYGSVTGLFEKIVDVVNKYFRLPARELHAIPYFVLASWFPEILSTPPTLVISGPSSAEARRLLRLLRCFCRHGVVVAELNPAGFWALPMHLHPTLLIDISGLTHQMRGLLRASGSRGAYIARRGEFMDMRCAKAVYSMESDIDMEVSEGMLRVTAPPTDAKSVFLDQREEDRIAAELQPQLLDYRLRSYQAVQRSAFDAAGFTTGVRELAQSLGAAVVSNPELQRGVVSLLSRQDEDVRVRWTTLPQFGVVTALLSLIHERRRSELLVSRFTTFVNAALRANGEILKYSPEEIGRRIAAMGLFTNRTKRGNVIKLTRQMSRLAHDLSQRYGVTTTPASFPGCPDCEAGEMPGTKRLM